MDRNAFDRRFSLNATEQMSLPIAESTCLNGSTSMNGSGWLGNQLSPKQRSNSNLCLTSQLNSKSNKSGIINKSISAYHTSNRSRLNLMSMDPRTYADVHSSGFASRVVKYSEQNRQMHRSMSVNNLYNKPGQFPVIHLKKKDLPYKATTRTVSMTRIPPPDRAIYYGNTVSSLMHSSSVVGIKSAHKTDAELSCENRPILHPPPTESEPTRSVLEVLKEISRKRINSSNEDIHQNEATKKSCNREYSDLIDTTHMSSLHINGSISNAVNYKRQRELQNQGSNVTPDESSIANICAQKSPEQIAKRRYCGYNNDITSSLSSSLKQANKRKYYEQKHNSSNSQSLNSTVNSSPETTQEAKIQRKQSEQFQKEMSCNTPITALPATPCNHTLINGIPNLISREDIFKAQRTICEPVFAQTTIINSELTPVKPKLTLFNKNYDNTEIIDSPSKNNTESEETKLDECAGIPFVKPKKTLSLKNHIIERTQKSKLALMLSGLRGEIYQGEDPELDACDNEKSDTIQMPTKWTIPVTTAATTLTITSAVMEPKSLSTTMFTTNATTTTSSSTTKTTSIISNAPPSAYPIALSLVPTTAAASSNSSITPTTATLSNVTPNIMFSIPNMPILPANTTITTSTTTLTNIEKQTTASSTTTIKKITVANITTNGTTVTTTPTISTISQKLDFSFKTTKATSLSTSASDTAKTSASTVPAGLFAFSNSNTTPISKENSSTFGASSTENFSFGLVNNLNANTNATKTSASTTTLATVPATTDAPSFSNIGDPPKPVFNFGRVADTSNSSAKISPNNSTIEAKPSFEAITPIDFGNTNNAINIFESGTFKSTNNAMVKPFSFGTASSVIDKTTTAPSTTIDSSAAVAFTFGGATTTSNAPAKVNTSSSASVATNKSETPAITTTTNAAASDAKVEMKTFLGTSLGTQNNTSKTQQFSFGVASSTATSNAAAAGGSNENSKSLFAFGVAPAATTNVHAVSTQAPASTNLFSFGQKINATPFSFGAGGVGVSNNATNPKLGAPFSFGCAVTNNVNLNSEAKLTTNTFSFSTTPTVTPTPTKQQPAAVGTATPSSGSLFGFTGTSNQAAGGASSSIFGSTTLSAANPASASSTSNLPFSFASGTAESAFGTSITSSGPPSAFSFGGATPSQTNKPIAGGFAFSNNTNPPVAGNLFGSISTPTAAAQSSNSNTGIVKPNFSFGGNSAVSNNANGGTNVGGNTFNALAAVSQQQQPPPQQQEQRLNTFAFGTNTNTASVNSAVNIFGSSIAAANGNNSKSGTAVGGFSFGGTNTTGGSTTSTNTPFAFGGGGAAAAPTTSTNKPFTFGANSTPSPAPNMFGATQSMNNAPFSFTGSTATPAVLPTTPQNPNSGNIFALPAPSPGDRPIRRATRRLHPTK